MIMIVVVVLRTKPFGLYRHRRDLGLYIVGYKERKVHDPNAKLAIHAREGPIWTRRRSFYIVSSRPISPTYVT